MRRGRSTIGFELTLSVLVLGLVGAVLWPKISEKKKQNTIAEKVRSAKQVTRVVKQHESSYAISDAKLLNVNEGVVDFKTKEGKPGSRMYKLCIFQTDNDPKYFLLPAPQALAPMKKYVIQYNNIYRVSDFTTERFVNQHINSTYITESDKIIDPQLDGVITNLDLNEKTCTNSLATEATKHLPAAKFLYSTNDMIKYYDEEGNTGTHFYQLCTFQIGNQITELLNPNHKALWPNRMYEIEIDEVHKNPQTFTTGNLALMYASNKLVKVVDNRLIDPNLDGVIKDIKMVGVLR